MTQSSYWLVMNEGPIPGQKFDLQESELVFGRDSTAGIMIDAPSVSRRHARIWIEGDAPRLEDLGSSNGTFVNGKKISAPVTLKIGDRIGLGRAVVLLVQGNAPAVTVLESRPSQATVMDTPAPETSSAPPLTNATMVSERNIDSMKTVIGKAPEAQLAQPPLLEVTIAGGKAQTYTLTRQQYSIGRAEDSDIVIPSPIVSRKMAVYRQTPSGPRLEVYPDVANPVFLGGRPLTADQVLQHGDVMRIGGSDPGVMVTLRFLAPAQVQAVPQRVDFSNRERVTIGRDSANDLVLKTTQVSRFHAQIERVGQRYRVTDLRSVNGTFVNDKRIEGSVWLQPNDTVRIGSNRFVMGAAGLSHVEEGSGLRVEAVGLNKWVRKDLNLLKDISLVLEPREFVVVVGQSGGGKSTLVDAIAGYRPATHGRVLVNGIDVYRNFDAIRNEIGYVPQKDIIHMELTVYQALDYAAQLRMPADTTKDERHKRIMQVLEDLDLTHRKDVQISGLSGGQQKRVSIGVELLTSPGLFFLDEPTSGLDPGTETALMQLMRHLADQGRTIILITHATKNVMLADKVAFLARGGFLAWYGPPDEALAYFDQYRSERDRRSRPIEFDEIYAILDDQSRGSAEEWAKRFRAHPAFQKYITQPLGARGHVIQPGAPAAAPVAAPGVKKEKSRARRNISGLRQFFILSARNARILVRDRPSLVLMIAVSPILAMLDLVLSNVLGRDVFSYQNGNVASVITSLFMPIMYSVMVGALSQMREFVKESEIYKRERLVNLKVLPYVLSKVWVAALLALYQSMVYTVIHYLAYDMPGGTPEFLAIYVTLYLATLAGMMIGLASSALAPNANAAPMIVILFLVPQFVLGGAMVPVPNYISAPTSARWAFEAQMAITGVGSDVARDVCWALPEEQRNAMTLDDKQANGCTCMGINVLRENSCNFPGIGKSYDPVVDQPEPAAPPELGKPPADPVMPPAPEQPGPNADNVAMATYLNKLKDYQTQVDKIQNDYKASIQAYQNRADVFKEQSTRYQKDLSEWKIKRSAAVSEAEGIINTVQKDFAWTFVDKTDPAAYWAKIIGTWTSQGTIILVLLVIATILIWRKDASR